MPIITLTLIFVVLRSYCDSAKELKLHNRRSGRCGENPIWYLYRGR